MLEARFDVAEMRVRDRSDERDPVVQPDAVRAVVQNEVWQHVHWVPRAGERGYIVLVSRGEFGAWLYLVDPDGRVVDSRENLSASYLARPDDPTSRFVLLLGVMAGDNAVLTLVQEQPDGQLLVSATRAFAGWPMALVPSRGAPGVWVLTSHGVFLVDPEGLVAIAHRFDRRLWGPTSLTSNADGTRLAVGTPFRLITLRVGSRRIEEEVWWHAASCRVLDENCRCYQ